ncbi:MAG: YabP/YqfC family sporulation protein [Lachnospiraceae bacterium]|nr:YabP/YqfC family sporulation protein [Lachnospiraceae bacterium]
MLEQIRIAAAEGLKLPRDVVLGEVLISFVGRCSVTIENYRGILIYDDKTIKLQARHCKLQIYGRRLHIDYYNHDEMKITGQIQGMEFGD